MNKRNKPNKLELETHLYLCSAEDRGNSVVVAEEAPTEIYQDFDDLDWLITSAFDADYTIDEPGAYIGKVRISIERIE